MANESPHRSAPNDGHSADPVGDGPNAAAKSFDATAAAASYARPTDPRLALSSTTSCRSSKAGPTTSATSNCFARHATTQRRDVKPEPEPNATGHERREMCALECADDRNETRGVRAFKSLASPALRTDAGSRLRKCTGFHVFTKSPKPPEYQAEPRKWKGDTMRKKRVSSAHQRPGVVPPRSSRGDSEEPVLRRLCGSGDSRAGTKRADTSPISAHLRRERNRLKYLMMKCFRTSNRRPSTSSVDSSFCMPVYMGAAETGRVKDSP